MSNSTIIPVGMTFTSQRNLPEDTFRQSRPSKFGEVYNNFETLSVGEALKITDLDQQSALSLRGSLALKFGDQVHTRVAKQQDSTYHLTASRIYY